MSQDLVAGAMARGYTLDEIADIMGKQHGLDVQEIRARGYSSDEIIKTFGYSVPTPPKLGLIDRASNFLSDAYGSMQASPMEEQLGQPVPEGERRTFAEPRAQTLDFMRNLATGGAQQFGDTMQGFEVPDEPLIERLGAPVTPEKYDELRGQYEMATPDARQKMIATPGVQGNVWRALDQDYNAANYDLETVAPLDDRREAQVRRLQDESGAAPEVAANMAMVGMRAEDAAQITESPADRELIDYARDTTNQVLRTIPQTGKMAIDAARLPGDFIPFVSEALALASEELGGMVESLAAKTSPQLREKVLRMGELAQTGDTRGLVALLSQNPDLLMEVAIPSIGSMFLIGGVGAVGGKAAQAKMVAQRAAQQPFLRGSSSTFNRLVATRASDVATRSALAANVAVVAGAAFDETDGPQDAKYLAATIAGIGALVAGRMTGGGAEGALARSAVGAGSGRSAVTAVPKVMLREGGQEYIEEGGEALGTQAGEVYAGTREGFDLPAAHGQGVIGAAAGMVLGGGVGALTTGAPAPNPRARPAPPPINTERDQNGVTKVITPEQVQAAAAPRSNIDVDQDALLAQANAATGGMVDPATPDHVPFTPEVASMPSFGGAQGAPSQQQNVQAGPTETPAQMLARMRNWNPNRQENTDGTQATQAEQAEQGTSTQADAEVLGDTTRDSLIAQYEQAEPMSPQSDALAEQLKAVTQNDVEATLNSGDMPVFETGRNTFVTITPSAQQPGKYQLTRYNDDGVFGDTQYDSIEAAIRDNSLETQPQLAREDAEARLFVSLKAESEYQAKQTPTPTPAPAGVSTSTAPQLTASGKPFASEKSAATSAKSRKLDLVPVAVEGGWGLVPKQAAPEPVAAPVAPTAVPKARAATNKRRAAYAEGNPFRAFLGSAGGVSRTVQSDVMGDTGRTNNPMIPYAGPVFRANGRNLDELAMLALEAGFLTQADIDNPGDMGGTRKLADMIRGEWSGTPQTRIQDVEADQDARSESDDALALVRQLEAVGIDTGAMNVDDMAAALEGDTFEAALADVVNALTDDISFQRAVERAAQMEEVSYTDDLVSEEARIAIANEINEDAVERAAMQSEDQVDYLSRIEEIIRNADQQTYAAAVARDRQATEGRPRSASRDSASTAEGARAAPSSSEADPLLSSYSLDELAERQAAIDATEQAETRAEREAADKERATRERDDVRRRSEAAADTFELGQSAEDNLSGQGPLFSRGAPGKPRKPNRDAEYMAAIERGDMDAAQKLVDQAARDAGYISDTDYRMQHRAPNSEDDVSLAGLRDTDLVPADYWTKPQWYLHTNTEYQSFDAVKAAFRSADARTQAGRDPGAVTMWVYRSIPKDVKDSAFRNGDWVSPSREYAERSGLEEPGGYRVISMRVPIRDLYWDANSIDEFGYDDGKGYAYKDTKNNRKLTDVITRDDDGNIIPLSKRFNVRNDDPRFSFAGPNAATADTMALDTAKSRIESGENAETVRRETGWFKGNDGKWRFEINDSDARLQNLNEEDGTANRATGLAEVLDHPALFAAYPALADMDVRIDIAPGLTEKGSYSAAVPGDDQYFGRSAEINVSAPDVETALSVLMHEIQHGIQTVEGFAKGGSANAMTTEVTSRREIVDAYGAFAEQLQIAGVDTRNMPDLDALLIDPDQTIEDYVFDVPRNAENSSEVEWAADALTRAINAGSVSPFQQYRRLAGEVEARNTQTRQGMTDAERQATPPSATADVADADVIVVFNGTEMASAPAPANSRGPRAATPTPVTTLTAAFKEAFPNQANTLDRMIQRGENGQRGGVVFAEDEAALAQAFADKTGRTLEEAQKVLQYSRAWHGSPHRFDKFSLSAMGTGEGAQAYGWGLYFADSREVAEYYRATTRQGASIEERGRNDYVVRAPDGSILVEGVLLGKAHQAKDAFDKQAGALYAVELAPTEGQYLLWDKPLSEQSAEVRAALEKAGVIVNGKYGEEFGPTSMFPNAMDFSGQKIYKRIVERQFDTKREATTAARKSSEQEASDYLASIGIRGIKYLDGVSRDGSGEGNFNYVIFNDADVSIVEVMFSKDGTINGFYDPQSGLVFLNQSAVTADTIGGVMLHEAMHGGQNSDVDAKAMKMVADRDKASTPATLRPLMAEVAAKMEAAGVANDAREASAYIVEVAANYGRQNGFSVLDGKFMTWLDGKMPRLAKFLRDWIAGIRAWGMKHGINLNLTVDDLVAFSKQSMDAMARGEAVTGSGPVSGSRTSTLGPGSLAQGGGRGNPRPATLPAETVKRAAQRVTQDDMNRFTVVQNFLQDQGMTLDVTNDVWKAEVRMHGIIAVKIEEFRDRRIEPLIKRTQKAKINTDQMTTWLVAEHAAERNAQIRKVDQTNDAGSGMTDQQAQDILAGNTVMYNGTEYTFNAAQRTAATALANEYRAIAEDAKQMRLAAGLLDQDMVDAWEGAYTKYVPLKGGDTDGAQGGSGQRLSAKVRNARALGHDARAEMVVENLIRDYELAVHQSEKNRVAQTTLKLILDANNPEIGTVGRPAKRKVLRPGDSAWTVQSSTGLVVASFDNQQDARRYIVANKLTGAVPQKVWADPMVAYQASSMLAENEFQVYVKGNAIRVQLNDPILAQAYNRIGVDGLGWAFGVGRSINAHLSKVYTGLNPEFLYSNVQRDLQFGVIKMTADYGIKAGISNLKYWPTSFMQVLRYRLGGNGSNDLRQYLASGGTTGVGLVSDIERIGKDIQLSYDQYRGAIETFRAERGAKGAMRAAQAATWKLVNALTDWIEHLNASGENAMRLATFRTVRDLTGGDVAEAAVAAKMITTNFNKRGERGQHMSALYLFYNPAVQGTAAFAESMIYGKHKWQAWGLLAGMAGIGMLARMQWDDDEWEKLNEFDKTRNLLIRTGVDTYIKVPIAYGPGFFPQAAQTMYDMDRGLIERDVAAIRVASAFIEHFGPALNPLMAKEDVRWIDGLYSVAPTVPQMFMAPAFNINDFGGEMIPTSMFDEGKPDNQRMFRSTKGTAYADFAEWMNTQSGGTKSQKGSIDVSPETLKHWVTSLTGGAGAFVADTYSLGANYLTKELDPDSTELRDLPFVRKTFGKMDIRDLRRPYYDLKNKADRAKADYQRAIKAGEMDVAENLFKDNGAMISMYKMLNAYGAQIKNLRDQMDVIMLNDELTLSQKRAQVREIEGREAMVYREIEKNVEIFKDSFK